MTDTTNDNSDERRSDDRFRAVLRFDTVAEARRTLRAHPFDLVDTEEEDGRQLLIFFLDRRQIDLLEAEGHEIEVGENVSATGRRRQQEVADGDRFDGGRTAPGMSGAEERGVSAGYMNVTEVDSAIQALAATYADCCELVTCPNPTHEGRTVRGLRIGRSRAGDRPAIAFFGGQHAREWGTAEICVNFATDLLGAQATGAGLSYGGKTFSAATIERLVDEAQILVLPTLNPDGRHYSQTRFAMWRKNRNPDGPVDCNRNYDFLWDFGTALHPEAGASVSDDPDSDVYHGPAPFSEPETRNVRWILDSYRQIRWAIDIHSYGQLLYHVWGHDQNQTSTPEQNFTNPEFDGQRGLEDDDYGEYIPPGDLSVQQGLVGAMRDAVETVRGMRYKTGQSFSLYPTTGTLTSYPYSRHIADPSQPRIHSFLIEWGTEFQPPWSEMEAIILDISAALVAFADHALTVGADGEGV